MEPNIVAQGGFFDLYVLPWTIRIIVAIAIWFVGKWVAEKLTALLRRLMTRANMDVTLVQFLGNIAYIVLLAVVIIAVLDQVGIQTTSMLAVFGAAGLAVGLALKDSLGNFASGVMLILFRPFKVGDQIEAGGVTGTVEEIRIFSTLLRTGDNREITVPNGTIANGVITNDSARPTRRVDLTFGIGYEDDLRQARSILEKVVAGQPLILSDPAPSVTLSDLAENSVNFAVSVWTKTENTGSVRAGLLEKAKLAFDDAGISLPYPQRVVYLHALPDGQPPAGDQKMKISAASDNLSRQRAAGSDPDSHAS